MIRSRIRRQGRKGRARAAGLAALRPAVLAAFGHRCAVPWCRKAERLEVHHVVKRSHGGGDVMDNLIPLCAAHHRQTDAPRARRLFIDGPQPWTFYEGDVREK